MEYPFLGEILIVPFNFAPKGWAKCEGQLFPINQNQALFSLLGTQYGGNGQTNFALPDFRGRLPVHQGAAYIPGQKVGQEAVTLTINTIPAHVHAVSGLSLSCSSVAATLRTPAGNVPARESSGVTAVYSSNANAAMSAQAITGFVPTLALTGGSQPHENLAPFLTLTFIIALQGIFPSRN